MLELLFLLFLLEFYTFLVLLAPLQQPVLDRHSWFDDLSARFRPMRQRFSLGDL